MNLSSSRGEQSLQRDIDRLARDGPALDFRVLRVAPGATMSHRPGRSLIAPLGRFKAARL
jgi:hypothetical protein